MAGNEASRVVHVRLKDSTIVGCIDVLRANGIYPEQASIARVVSRAVMAMVNGLAKSGAIPLYTEEEARNILRSQFLHPGEGPLVVHDMPFPTIREDEPRMSDEEANVVRERVKESAEDAMRRMEAGGFTEDVPLDKLPEPKKEVKEITFDELKKRVPSDQWIERAEKGSLYQKRAVGIVYSNVDPSLWGTDRAGEMILAVEENLRALDGGTYSDNDDSEEDNSM